MKRVSINPLTDFAAEIRTGDLQITNSQPLYWSVRYIRKEKAVLFKISVWFLLVWSDCRRKFTICVCVCVCVCVHIYIYIYIYIYGLRRKWHLTERENQSLYSISVWGPHKSSSTWKVAFSFSNVSLNFETRLQCIRADTKSVPEKTTCIDDASWKIYHHQHLRSSTGLLLACYDSSQLARLLEFISLQMPASSGWQAHNF
jgi:hypothetical protein